MRNQVVAHFIDGRLLKGFAVDFFPNKTSFHVEREESGESIEVQISDLKGVFFVKSFAGNPGTTYRKDVERAGMGKKIQVEFSDGEQNDGGLIDRIEVDPEDNNEKVYVVSAATTAVNFV